MLGLQRLLILCYHRVLDRPDPLCPNEMCIDVFDAHVRALSRFFNILPLTDAVDRLATGTLPPRAVSITFDDGYRDNYTNALPVLKKYGARATFFVATDFLDGGRMWNDTVIEALRNAPESSLDLEDLKLGVWPVQTPGQKLAAVDGLLAQLKYLQPAQRLETVDALAARIGAPLPDDLMMQPDEVRGLFEQGMEIGGHTVSHPILSRLDDAVAQQEISTGRAALQDLTGAPVDAFAYPNGKPGSDYEKRHVEMVRQAGFRMAVTTGWGCVGPETDPYQLGRLGPWDRSGTKLAMRLLRSYFGSEAAVA